METDVQKRLQSPDNYLCSNTNNSGLAGHQSYRYLLAQKPGGREAQGGKGNKGFH